MLKNFVIWSSFYTLAGIVLTSVITESLNKSTFNSCKANVSKYNEACIQVLKTGSSYQKQQVLTILAINENKS
jgi:hypothetical protein|tara:strand:+ start:975 stop:1193 length:219 start_codon:yes stop_codon:yes gene_type:complete